MVGRGLEISGSVTATPWWGAPDCRIDRVPVPPGNAPSVEPTANEGARSRTPESGLAGDKPGSERLRSRARVPRISLIFTWSHRSGRLTGTTCQVCHRI